MRSYQIRLIIRSGDNAADGGSDKEKKVLQAALALVDFENGSASGVPSRWLKACS